MGKTGIATDPAAIAYFWLLGANALVFLICLIAGPRVWSRRLGRFFIWLNGFVLLAVAIFLAEFVIPTGVQDEGGLVVGFLGAVSIPVFLEFLSLLAVARLRLRPRKAAPL